MEKKNRITELLEKKLEYESHADNILIAEFNCKVNILSSVDYYVDMYFDELNSAFAQDYHVTKWGRIQDRPWIYDPVLYEAKQSLDPTTYKIDKLRLDIVFVHMFGCRIPNDKNKRLLSIDNMMQYLDFNPYAIPDVLELYIKDIPFVGLLFDEIYKRGFCRVMFWVMLKTAFIYDKLILYTMSRLRICRFINMYFKTDRILDNKRLHRNIRYHVQYDIYPAAKYYFRILFLSNPKKTDKSSIHIIKKSAIYEHQIIRIINRFL